jgi:hypothetical protein
MEMERMITTQPTLELEEADINLLLANAAILRSSFLGGDCELIRDDEGSDYSRHYADADRFDDLAVKLAPFCVPPLAELEQECSDCDDGVAYGHRCLSCLGTALWPPTRDGVRVRLLPEVAR